MFPSEEIKNKQTKNQGQTPRQPIRKKKVILTGSGKETLVNKERVQHVTVIEIISGEGGRENTKLQLSRHTFDIKKKT